MVRQTRALKQKAKQVLQRVILCDAGEGFCQLLNPSSQNCFLPGPLLPLLLLSAVGNDKHK